MPGLAVAALETGGSICTGPIPPWPGSSSQQTRGPCSKRFSQITSCLSARQQELISQPHKYLRHHFMLPYRCCIIEFHSMRTWTIWISASNTHLRTWRWAHTGDWINATKILNSHLYWLRDSFLPLKTLLFLLSKTRHKLSFLLLME
jgi:hypothetical protein